jgi:hypothetical protein
MNRLYLLFCLVFITVGDSKAQPVPEFTVDRINICNGTTVQLTNSSTGANNYEWLIDGINYPKSPDTVATLFENCYGVQEIKLYASDTINGLTDSQSIYVDVFDTCFFHWTADIFKCPGDLLN